MKRLPKANDAAVDSFINMAKDAQVSNPAPAPKVKKPKAQDVVRQTYYITPQQVSAIKKMAFFDDMDKSEIVRLALEQFIPDKYKAEE